MRMLENAAFVEATVKIAPNLAMITALNASKDSTSKELAVSRSAQLDPSPLMAFALPAQLDAANVQIATPVRNAQLDT